MILIIGAGGHGQVVADIFRALRACGAPAHDTAFLDDDRRQHGSVFAGSVVLGCIEELASIPHDGLILGLGDNKMRSRMHARLVAAGETFAIARHPRSIVAEDVAIGPGSMLCAGSIVNTGTLIGQNAIINTGATVDHHCRISNHVHIGPGVHIGGEVRVEEGAFIGIGAVILPRVTVAPWSTVGAGAVVTKDVTAGSTVVGVPARSLRASVGV